MARPLPLIALCALVLVPLGAASWASQGASEPDTWIDRASGFMFSQPDTSPSQAVSRVYFNGFSGTEAGDGTGFATPLSPNAAALATAHASYPQRAWAMLGVWKDCNHDGYVGSGEQGLLEYRTTLLDATVGERTCPAGPVPVDPATGAPPEGWTPVHNDGAWVHELFALGWRHREPDGSFVRTDPWTLEDSGLRAWSDDGVPGQPPSETSCRTFAPRGTYHSVGALVAYLDCYDAERVGRAASSLPPQAAPLWTRVADVANPWGDEGDPAVVGVWDCSRPIYGQYAPVPLSIYSPSPRLDTRAVSPAGETSAVLSGFDFCNRATRDDGGTHVEHVAASAPYALELDEGGDMGFVRNRTDFALVYDEPVRGSPVGGPWALADGGSGNGILDAPPFWHSDSVRSASRNPYFSRSTLGPDTVRYATYYAWVPVGLVAQYGLSMPGGPRAWTYGAEACGAATSGIVNGWQCDRTPWYAEGSEPRAHELGGRPSVPGDGVPIGPRPGDPYDLRDVDCYDESAGPARSAGLTYGMLSGTACA